MGKMRLKATVDVLYHDVNRELVTHEDQAKVIERKLSEALEHENADVTVVVNPEGR
jgi:hypothetical protein